MASVFPVIGSWWIGKGYRVGDGKYIELGSSSTPFETSASSVGKRKWTAEIIYTSGDDNQLAMRANWFTADKGKTNKQDFIVTWNLPAGVSRAMKFEFELPGNYPMWTPSVAVPNTGHDISIAKLDLYETPEPGLKVNLSGGRGSEGDGFGTRLLYTSPSPRDVEEARMPSSA